MCPDDALLSAFYDGEVGNPWKDKIESHLKECENCRAKLDAFAAQSGLLADDPLPEFSASYDDMAKIIRRRETVKAANPFASAVRLPAVPLAAAAAAVLAFFLGLTLSGPAPGPNASFADMPVAVAEGWSVPPGDLIITGDDIEAVLAAMDQNSSSMFNQEASLELPVNLNLAMIGDSELVRSASYAGGASR